MQLQLELFYHYNKSGVNVQSAKNVAENLQNLLDFP